MTTARTLRWTREGAAPCDTFKSIYDLIVARGKPMVASYQYGDYTVTGPVRVDASGSLTGAQRLSDWMGHRFEALQWIEVTVPDPLVAQLEEDGWALTDRGYTYRRGGDGYWYLDGDLRHVSVETADPILTSKAERHPAFLAGLAAATRKDN